MVECIMDDVLSDRDYEIDEHLDEVFEQATSDI